MDGAGPWPALPLCNSRNTVPLTSTRERADREMDYRERIKEEDVEDMEEEEEEGPPPGWEKPIHPPPPHPQADGGVEDEDPPPRCQSVPPPPSSSEISIPSEIGSKVEEIEGEDEDEDDDEGPPPGWESIPSPKASLPPTPCLPPSFAVPSDSEMENKEKEIEDEEDGPPPGWHHPIPIQQSPQTVTNQSDTKMECVNQCIDDDGPPPGWLFTTPPQSAVFSGHLHKDEDGGPPPRRQSTPIRQSIPSARSVSSEKGQMVCGSCQRLLSYPRGSKFVQCSCCQTINLVLEAQQLGQVKCGSCTVLLMYPYGAKSVRCSSCRFVTEITLHNRRPTLSVQQSRRRRSNPVH